MKRIECRNHPKHAITNFCKNPQCYLPLCPECVVLHTSFHRERNWHGEFDTIENTLEFCDSKLEDFEKRYLILESTLFESINEIKRSEAFFQEKLENAKKGLISAVEKSIESLKRDVSIIYKGILEGMTHDFELMSKELKEKKLEMANMRKNLDIYPSKTIIELYSTIFVIDHHNFQSQVSDFNEHLKDQSLEIELNNHTLRDIEMLILDNLIVFSRKNLNNKSSQKFYRSPEPKIPKLRMNMENRELGFNREDRMMRSPNYSRIVNNFEFGSPMR